MGFSGQNGRPAFSNLLSKLQSIGYYKELFTIAYGTETITEARIQECLSQFIRSIQSFDSKYDAGRALVNNDNQRFPILLPRKMTGKHCFLLRLCLMQQVTALPVD